MLCTPWQLEQLAATTEPPSDGEAVVAVDVGGDAVAGDAELLRETHSLMAARACVAREILLGDGRLGSLCRLDGVDAVAVSADRREAVAVGDRLAVDALR